jgi:hypothetical protein
MAGDSLNNLNKAVTMAGDSLNNLNKAVTMAGDNLNSKVVTMDGDNLLILEINGAVKAVGDIKSSFIYKQSYFFYIFALLSHTSQFICSWHIIIFLL